MSRLSSYSVRVTSRQWIVPVLLAVFALGLRAIPYHPAAVSALGDPAPDSARAS